MQETDGGRESHMKIGQSPRDLGPPKPGESGAQHPDLCGWLPEPWRAGYSTPSIAFLAMSSLDVVKEGGTHRKGGGQAYRGMEGQAGVCVTSNPPN